MPTYEYACAACGNEWEEMQRITEPALEACPKCHANAAHRLISGGTNFILKGGGWYSDLYASPKATPKKEDAASTPAPGAADGTKPEPKSETKASATTSAAPATSAPATSSS
jgi:putative FmdB family regulatory protein